KSFNTFPEVIEIQNRLRFLQAEKFITNREAGPRQAIGYSFKLCLHRIGTGLAGKDGFNPSVLCNILRTEMSKLDQSYENNAGSEFALFGFDGYVPVGNNAGYRMSTAAGRNSTSYD